MPVYIRRCTLLLLIAFMILPARAQKKGYSPGYIITNNGKTIEGQVKDRSSGAIHELYKQIRFKATNASFKRKYSPDEILGYGSDDQHFESLPLVEESDFLKFRYYLDEREDRFFVKIVAGNKDLTYYHWEYVDNDSNYLDYIPLFHRRGSGEMVRVTQGMFGLKRKRLMEYFWDCPELVHAIEKKELNEILEVYDFYMENCIRNVE